MEKIFLAIASIGTVAATTCDIDSYADFMKAMICEKPKKCFRLPSDASLDDIASAAIVADCEAFILIDTRGLFSISMYRRNLCGEFVEISQNDFE